jgi:hypothetical protein
MSCFFKVKSHLGLERECMYASRARGSDGYGVLVEKELVKKHFGEKYSLTSKNGSPPSILFYKLFYIVQTAPFVNRLRGSC